MSDIVWNIEDESIDQEDTEIEIMLAHLLINQVIFCNNGWWFAKENKSWPKDYITLHVNCNDVFAWGCADAEDITYSEVPALYKMWRKDPVYGAAIWCIQKRKLMPQFPLEKIIREKTEWNLDSMGLEKNG